MSYSTENGSAATLVRTPSGESLPGKIELQIPKKLERGERLGKGGMGEVFACTDHQLTRTVALKVATTRESADLERFVREARIQGQLQHPSIVPVHELGSTDDGAPYFTMKKVQGVTLQQIIERLAAGDADARAQFTRRKLLSAYVSICQAIEFAHQHGILHRDLKPANVMLGDFGEVYVLDWGLAKKVGAEELGPHTLPPLKLDLDATGSTPTVAGSLLGTPGYLAPEQVIGGAATVRSDIYSLGVMLFELLTWKRAIEAPLVRDVLLKTRDGFDARARVRAPERDIAPELEAICVKACAVEPELRQGSVRELLGELERYLEGQRDHEMRALASQRHSELARAAAAEVKDPIESRRRSMQEVGRALALDPNNRGAIEVLLSLLQTPPTVVPEEVKADLDKAEAARARTASMNEAVGYGALATFLPICIAMGIRAPWVIGLYVASALAACMVAWKHSMRPGPTGRVSDWITVIASPAMFVSGYLISPFILLPAMVVLHMFTTLLFMPKRVHVAGVAIGIVATLLPFVTWWAGLTPTPVRFTPEGILLVPTVLEFPARWTMMMLVGSNIGFAVFAVYASRNARRQMERGEQQMVLQSWTVRQMLPQEAAHLGRPVEPVTPEACAL